VHDVIAGHVAKGNSGGVAWLAARDGQVEVGTAGTLTRGEDRAVARDTLFRIASMTKPMTAVAALILVEECRLRLDEPVNAWLPELADRRVLVDRSGPPEPQVPPEPDEWMRRVSTLPLLCQPGERWLYNTGSDLLGVLIARAAGQPLHAFLRERVFEPLGMVDTGFFTKEVARLGSSYGVDPATGERSVYDPPDGQWSRPPAFPSAAGGLLSTVDDVHAFGRMLLDNGRLPDGSQGWGFGVSVQVRRVGVARSVGSYGWDGGLGSSWANDPTERLVAIVLTTDAFTGPFPPPTTIQDFWTSTYASFDD